MSHINSGYVGVDKRSSKGGVYGLRKHRQERSLGNFKSIIDEANQSIVLKFYYF